MKMKFGLERDLLLRKSFYNKTMDNMFYLLSVHGSNPETVF